MPPLFLTRNSKNFLNRGVLAKMSESLGARFVVPFVETLSRLFVTKPSSFYLEPSFLRLLLSFRLVNRHWMRVADSKLFKVWAATLFEENNSAVDFYPSHTKVWHFVTRQEVFLNVTLEECLKRFEEREISFRGVLCPIPFMKALRGQMTSTLVENYTPAHDTNYGWEFENNAVVADPFEVFWGDEEQRPEGYAPNSPEIKRQKF